MNQNHLNPKRPVGLTGTLVDGGPALGHTERSLIDTATTVSYRLGDIERKLSSISNYLFGPEPCCDEFGRPSAEPNLRSLLEDAFCTSVRLERAIDDIYQRLVETN